MAVFDPSAYSDPKVIEMTWKHGIILDMDRNGMGKYHCRKLKKFPWLLGVAKDLDTVGCLTVRKIAGVDDIAVYPHLSLHEVIDSFSSDDNIAACNCYYVKTIAEAARILRGE